MIGITHLVPSLYTKIALLRDDAVEVCLSQAAAVMSQGFSDASHTIRPSSPVPHKHAKYERQT